MSYEVINIHLSEKATPKKKEIRRAAEHLGMSVSQFLLWCYEQVINDKKNIDLKNVIQ